MDPPSKDDHRNSNTHVHMPKSSADFSSNWKNLLSKGVLHKPAAPDRTRESKAGSRKNELPRKVVVAKGSSSYASVLKTLAKKPLHESLREHGNHNLGVNVSATEGTSPKLTKCVAIDCEFVGVGADGSDDQVARVSVVNLYGDCLYDKFVAPVERVVDYRTKVSGVRPENLTNAPTLKVVQKEVSDIINGRILIGHNVRKDLQVLFLSHPKKDLRDTSRYRVFRVMARTKFPALKKLATLVLGISFQSGEHDSVSDARVTMLLYRSRRKEWEEQTSNAKYRLGRTRVAATNNDEHVVKGPR